MNNMHMRCLSKFVIATQWVALAKVILNINLRGPWKGASCSNKKNDTNVRNPETGTRNGPDLRATRSTTVACAGVKWLDIIEVCQSGAIV